MSNPASPSFEGAIKIIAGQHVHVRADVDDITKRVTVVLMAKVGEGLSLMSKTQTLSFPTCPEANMHAGEVWADRVKREVHTEAEHLRAWVKRETEMRQRCKTARARAAYLDRLIAELQKERVELDAELDRLP